MDITIARNLESGLTQLGLQATVVQQRQLLTYMDLLKRWNKTYNLTALKTDEQILVHHILDSLAVVKPLQTHFAGLESLRGLDVGSGGGLPGVILAVMNPTWQIVCIDAVEKKTSFILQVAGILGLKNLTSKHTRIEAYDIEPVDLVISRAFASLVDFADWAGRHVSSTGSLVAMKGHYLEDEVDALRTQSDWDIVQYLPITVPYLEAERCLMYLKKTRKGN